MEQLLTLPPVAQLLVFALAFAAIVPASDLLIGSASLIAKRFGISELVVGLTVVAMGTSAPEFAVTVMASAEGSGGIALGNVVGSNIFNVGIVLAIFVLYRPVPIQPALLYREGLFLVLAATMLLGFAFNDGAITRFEGGVLAATLALYLGLVVRLAIQEEKAAVSDGAPAPVFDKELVLALLKLLLGLIILLGGAKVVVDLAIGFARTAGVSEWFIGSTLVAGGTSLPELVTAITAIRKKAPDIGLGNILGSELFNMLGVVGAAALLSPMSKLDDLAPLAMMLGMTVFFVGAMRWNWTLGRPAAITLMLLGFARWAVSF